jgi:hypothetical protein
MAVRPIDESLRNHFANVDSPGFEVRPQRITIRRIHYFCVEILVEERWEDFNGIVPLPSWLDGHEASFAMFSAAK